MKSGSMIINLSMKTILLLIITAVTLLSSPVVNFGQSPNLGTAVNFVLFSSVGAVGNTGVSQLTGNVGSNNGAMTGFGVVNGVMHNADAATAQCVTDLQALWYYLDTLAPTLTIGPVLGNGDTLFAGVDTIAAAGSLVGVLYLDAQGDPNAIFIIKSGGAFSTAATATVNLINGASACNVFWVAEGAIGMATLTTMRGNLISHNAAIAIGAGCTLEGRALSTTGSVTVYGTLAYTPPGCGAPPPPGPLTPAPLLRTVECYVLFSSIGAVYNLGDTYATGHIGTNIGLTTGYNSAFVTGFIHPIPDSSTSQCAADLAKLYAYLDSLPSDIELLYPAQFGNNLVLTPHTYHMSAAATLTDTLYLDAEGNADAVFVIKIEGALVTSTFSNVRLINGTQPRNVYWQVEGAVTINDNSIFCGTIVSHNGAIVLNTGVRLEGRALTTTGALTTTAMTANKPPGGLCYVLPVRLLSFTGGCDKQNVVLKWSAATETNNDYYSIERSEDGINWQVAGTVGGAGNSSETQNYSFTDKEPYNAVSYYRLKQTDIDGKFKYFKIISIANCQKDPAELGIYPNPANGTFHLLFHGDKDQVHSVSIYNVSGEKVYNSENYQSSIDLSGKPDGVYFLHFNLLSTVIIKKLVIKN
jgi:hypothetical protein